LRRWRCSAREGEANEVAMRGVYAGAAKFYHFAAKCFVRREVKFALAIITKICRRQLTGLPAIRSDSFARREFLDDQMITKFVETTALRQLKRTHRARECAAISWRPRFLKALIAAYSWRTAVKAAEQIPTATVAVLSLRYL